MTVSDLRVRSPWWTSWWTPRRSRWLLVALHVPLAAMPPVLAIMGFTYHPRGDAWLVIVALGIAILALQLWHSFAAVRDETPGGWPWTLVALGACVYVPMWWFNWNWASTQYFVIASA